MKPRPKQRCRLSRPSPFPSQISSPRPQTIQISTKTPNRRALSRRPLEFPQLRDYLHPARAGNQVIVSPFPSKVGSLRANRAKIERPHEILAEIRFIHRRKGALMAPAAATPSINSNVASFITQKKQMLINGKWVDSASGKTFASYNPATGEVLANVAEGDREDIDRAVKAARAAFETGPWSKISPSERGQMILRLGDLLQKHLEEYAQLESLDNGKPLKIARVADLPLAIDHFRYYAGWATKIEGNTVPMSGWKQGMFHAYTMREPVGVVGQIIPWNFPLLMAAWKLGPALATGCTIVLKPAEQTPLTALRLGELIQEAGIPDGVVNIVPGYGETAGAALAAHPDVDKVAFTGSTEVGKLILQAATGNLKKVSLELGGKSPNIVFEDADIPSVIPAAAGAIFFNHGQCCCAGSRLYVEEKSFDKAVEGAAAEAKKIRVGSGLDSHNDMG